MYDIIIVGSGLSSSAFLKGFGKTNKKIGLISPSNFKIQKKKLPQQNYMNICMKIFLQDLIKII